MAILHPQHSALAHSHSDSATHDFVPTSSIPPVSTYTPPCPSRSSPATPTGSPTRRAAPSSTFPWLTSSRLREVPGRTAITRRHVPTAPVSLEPRRSADSRLLRQWVAERSKSSPQTNSTRWTFRNVATGLYLGIDGAPKSAGRVVATRTETEWDVRPDREDPSALR